MASSSPHNNGVPVATLLEWYKIRDAFFGHNCVSQNIPLSLELASPCQHPDARWLTEACAGQDVTTKEDAKRVFSAIGQNDACALCFLWCCDDDEGLSPLRRAAELCFPLAQAWMAGSTDTIVLLRTSLWLLSLPHLAIIQMLIGSLSLALERT
jgi:hypothetical protein